MTMRLPIMTSESQAEKRAREEGLTFRNQILSQVLARSPDSSLLLVFFVIVPSSQVSEPRAAQ